MEEERIGDCTSGSCRDPLGMPYEFVATRLENVSKSPVDFFSLGHIVMGQFTFVVVFVVVSGGVNEPGFLSVLLSLFVGIGWEFIENTALYAYGIKFESKLDSTVNSTFDVFFVFIGAVTAYVAGNVLVVCVLAAVELAGFLAWGYCVRSHPG